MKISEFLKQYRRKFKQPKLFFKEIAGTSSLHELGKLSGTDKVNDLHSFKGFSYMDIYEKYFRHLKESPISLLEIGVRDGDSLRTWEKYFSRGRICGIDINPDCKSSHKGRVEVEIGSQDDPKFLTDCFGSDTMFDIIIDDGSHVNSLTLATFENIFSKRLKSGGIYIVKDLGCSYSKLQSDHNVRKTWPGMKHIDNSIDLDNNREDLDTFFRKKIYELDHMRGDILSIQFWSMVCIILKA